MKTLTQKIEQSALLLDELVNITDKNNTPCARYYFVLRIFQKLKEEERHFAAVRAEKNQANDKHKKNKTMNTAKPTTQKNKVYKSQLERISLVKEDSDFKREKITGSASGAVIIKKFFSGDIEIFESFFILMLNRCNNTVGYAKISQGGISGTVVDTKIICKMALDTLCSSVIISHNHPSGNTQPSSQDIEITKKIKAALHFFDIEVLDHIIVTKNEFYSFADEGMM